MTVVVRATYLNHDEWPSPIEVPDDPNWTTTYGTTILGTVKDSGDGKMAATLTIYRAGDYTLEILVNGIHIADSPHQSLLKVVPSSLNGANCEVVEVPVTMNAGFNY